MTDQRLRELFEERVADLTTVDLTSEAWDRASVVRRRRRTVAGVAVAVVAVIGGMTVVLAGDADDDASPPPATSSTDSEPVPLAVRGGTYAGLPVWWAPAAEGESQLPEMGGTALPPMIDLTAPDGPVPAGMRAVGVFQLAGDDSSVGRVVVVGVDGASYSLDVSRLSMLADETGNVSAPVSQESVSPNGRYAFFPQERSLEVYDLDAASWHSIPLRRWAARAASWTADGTAIQIQRARFSSPFFDLYAPSGGHVGTTRESDGFYVGPRGDDDYYGPVRRAGDGRGARGLFLAGPLTEPSGQEVSSVDAIGAGGDGDPQALLAFSQIGGGEGRWLQCCPIAGWLDDNVTVLFESRHANARILAWRVGTRGLSRVSDIRGWTPGEESYVASFADLSP